MSVPLAQTLVSAKPRKLPPDIENPEFEDLFDLSLSRVLDAARPYQNSPPRLFPTSESFYGNAFSAADWLNHGRLELEFARMNYTLLQIRERSIPASMTEIVRQILASDSILKAWRRSMPQIRVQITREIRLLTGAIRTSGHTTQDKLAHLALPKDYRTLASSPKLARQLWKRSLAEIIGVICSGNGKYVRQFLEVYAFLKDPLGGLQKPFEDCAALFVQLMVPVRQLARKSRQSSGRLHFWNYAVAQAAHEALFLMDPLLRKISYIHFSHHHQLCYIYTKLDDLPRSEFSIASHVVQVLEEIVTSPDEASGGECLVPPIAVATYPSLANYLRKNETVIIDGNHRSTAVMILRFVAEYPAALTQDDNSLSEFCHKHGLSIKWEIDLSDVMQTLRQSSCAILLRQSWNVVLRFRHIDSVPALVVQEADFHTVCQQRPWVGNRRPHALLPVHQALFNDPELGLAFPQAGQVHGRTPGFKAMPLLSSEQVII